MEPEKETPNISVREYLESIIDRNDKLYDSRFKSSETSYDQRFRASEIAIQAALLAQKESVASAFLASEKAIVKAEEAQRDYNVAHNDLSHKMDEQNKGTMPRPEILALFTAHDDKIEAMRSFYDSKFESQRMSFEKNMDSLGREIASLRESRSEGTGKTLGANALWGYLIAIASIAMAVIFHFVK